MSPTATSAPTIECDVEIGIPKYVRTLTVIAAASVEMTLISRLSWASTIARRNEMTFAPTWGPDVFAASFAPMPQSK